jgi:LacI family repressor for deo operon, udp, cdd, tsx, nupC, and nupG
MMTVKLKDVAARAGVSMQTVSNVIRGNNARVSAQTRRQVLAAAEALNYQPNSAARHLRNGRVGIIALAIPDLANPYYADLGNAVVAAAAACGYTVLLDHTRFDRASEYQAIGGLRPHAIDGVILEPQALEMGDLQALQGRVPVVLVGENLLDAPYDHVATDNVVAARMATDHLLALGRRRIAALGVDERKTAGAAHLRAQGYADALAEAGRPVDPGLLVSSHYWHREGGAEAMRALLALDDPPDAVFCFNDLLALGAMWTLHEAGCRIPDDVAVVGYDDIDDGRFARPSLTTIAPGKEGIGRLAVALLMGRIDGTRTGPPEHVEAPFQLRARGSTLGPAGRVDAV